MTQKKSDQPCDLSKLTLDQLIDEELRYSALTTQAEAQRKAIKAEILAKLQATGFQVGQSYVRADGVAAGIQTKTGTDKIERLPLIMAGVDEDIVNKATVKGKDSAPFVMVRLPKQQKQDFVLGGQGTAETSETRRH